MAVAIRRLMYRWLPIVVGLACQAPGMAQPSGSLVIRKGTVLTVSSGTLLGYDVLVEDGIITRLGIDLETPPGVREINAVGRYVMPGIIDVHAHLTDPPVEDLSALPAVTREMDQFDPTSIAVYRALAVGVTTAALFPGSVGGRGGIGQIVKLRYGVRDADVFAFEEAPRIVRLGRDGAAETGSAQALNVFDDASLGTENPGIADGPIVQWLVSTDRGVAEALTLVEELGIKKSLMHGAKDAIHYSERMARTETSVSVQMPRDDGAEDRSTVRSAYEAAALVRSGILTSLSSGSEGALQLLALDAAKLRRYGGLTSDDALKLITVNPARQLGIEQHVGSIEIGKDGDLVIFSGHPLSVYARPLVTIVDGIVRFDQSRDPDDMRLDAEPELRLTGVSPPASLEDPCISLSRMAQ